MVGALSRVRARARIDADQFLPIVRHYEIVFRELETGQGIYAARHDLADAPWGKCVPGYDFLRKRRDQRNRSVKVFVAAPPKIVLRLGLVSLRDCELSQVIVNLPQPSCMRCFVSVFQAPAQLGLGCLSLIKLAWKFSMHDTRNPVHDENLPSG